MRRECPPATTAGAFAKPEWIARRSRFRASRGSSGRTGGMAAASPGIGMARPDADRQFPLGTDAGASANAQPARLLPSDGRQFHRARREGRNRAPQRLAGTGRDSAIAPPPHGNFGSKSTRTLPRERISSCYGCQRALSEAPHSLESRAEHRAGWLARARSATGADAIAEMARNPRRGYVRSTRKPWTRTAASAHRSGKARSGQARTCKSGNSSERKPQVPSTGSGLTGDGLRKTPSGHSRQSSRNRRNANQSGKAASGLQARRARQRSTPRASKDPSSNVVLRMLGTTLVCPPGRATVPPTATGRSAKLCAGPAGIISGTRPPASAAALQRPGPYRLAIPAPLPATASSRDSERRPFPAPCLATAPPSAGECPAKRRAGP